MELEEFLRQSLIVQLTTAIESVWESPRFWDIQSSMRAVPVLALYFV
jgi:hypothetical protein